MRRYKSFRRTSACPIHYLRKTMLLMLFSQRGRFRTQARYKGVTSDICFTFDAYNHCNNTGRFQDIPRSLYESSRSTNGSPHVKSTPMFGAIFLNNWLTLIHPFPCADALIHTAKGRLIVRMASDTNTPAPPIDDPNGSQIMPLKRRTSHPIWTHGRVLFLDEMDMILQHLVRVYPFSEVPTRRLQVLLKNKHMLPVCLKKSEARNSE